MGNSCVVLMECLTNMHVGNGEVNYSIIDNEVERDPVTNYPVVNSSGVKGALRAYFKGLEDTQVVNKDVTTNNLFGDGNCPGALKILAAEMLAIPARASGGKKPYYLVSTEEALKRINNIARNLLGKIILSETDDNDEADNDACAEGVKLSKHKVIKLQTGEKIFVLHEEEFRKIELPVLARNCLENGISANLWYEELVPHESKFAFAVIADSDETLEEFKEQVNGKVVQFGGNATIGCGLCKLTVIE